MVLAKYLRPSAYRAFGLRKFVELRFTVPVSLEDEQSEQRAHFRDLGLDLDRGLEFLDDTLRAMGQPRFNDGDGMASQHWPLFAAIALGGEVHSVLEIGTYDAGTTALLARLFTSAAIVTIDLPDDSIHFVTSYGRENESMRRDFIARRNARLAKESNVHFLQVNSFNAPAHLGERWFDLIWIDGGHDYPVVAWDLFFSFHHLAEGGWMLADDVYRHPLANRFLSSANDTYAAVHYLSQDGTLAPRFIKKRLAAGRKNLVSEKHILVLRKPATSWAAVTSAAT